ncbi:MAG TPA: hypothetical protein VG929_09410 [Actinomycetota bacterium]|nr:hypothetical protein [Actinomycetota bacterium]
MKIDRHSLAAHQRPSWHARPCPRIMREATPAQDFLGVFKTPSVDDQIQILVRSRLLTKQSVDPPPTFDDGLDLGRSKNV